VKRLAILLTPLLLAATTPLDQESEHVVKAGETLGGVAERAKVPRILIIETNHLEAPYALRAGQKLTIPRTRHHTVKNGDTGFSIAYAYSVSWADIAVANGIDSAAALKTGQKLLIPTMIMAPRDTPTPAAMPAPTVAAAAKPPPAASPKRPESRPHSEVGSKPKPAVH
jgi:LysM repeat protein